MTDRRRVELAELRHQRMVDLSNRQEARRGGRVLISPFDGQIPCDFVCFLSCFRCRFLVTDRADLTDCFWTTGCRCCPWRRTGTDLIDLQHLIDKFPVMLCVFSVVFGFLLVIDRAVLTDCLL